MVLLKKFVEQSLLNIMFLGIFASAMCYVSWTFAIEHLGAIRASAYIYLSPVVTLFLACLILNEHIKIMSACGVFLALLGLMLSELKKSDALHIFRR